MSGIAGIVSLDEGPVDPQCLREMLRYLTPHGTDAHRIWHRGRAGLAHALLRTTPESATEDQPASLDGRVWIAADCRIDARDDLRRGLEAAGERPRADAPDVDLILHAYRAWGRQCVEHLLGDFSFAIWDTPRRTLFCARDHFGVKPFYYALTAHAFVFSNHLSAVRVHPSVPSDLDDAAIADFLVFGYVFEADRSSFRGIKRLAPGHRLTLAADGVTIERYWKLPQDSPLEGRRPEQVVEEFRELLRVATRDRLRTPRASVMMSGGLDSTAIAAMARAERGPNGLPVDLEAHTVVFDRIVRDEERHYSTIAAQALGIPVHHHPFDDYGFPAPEPEPAGYPPEPRLLLDWSRLIAVYRPAAASARVVLKGEGADTLLIATAAAPQRLLDQRRYGALLRAYLWLIWRRRQLPYFGVRTMLRQAFGHPPPLLAQPFPAWLQPPLVEQLRIRERWLGEAALEHDRPGDDLVTAYWPWIFESTDPVTLQLPAEMRYPFFDLRLVRWLLRVPQVPWCMEKSLLRIAMADRLPAPIIRRRKAPVAGNPWRSLVPPARDRWWEPFMTPAPELDRFVDLDVARRTLETVLPAAQDRNAHGDIDLLRSTLRPLSLNLWLTRVARGNLLSGSRQPR